MMYATLPRPTKPPSYSYHAFKSNTWRDGSEQQRMAYVELMGHEPPPATSAAMRAQFEYGHGQYRTKAARATILAAACEQQAFQLVAA